MKPLAEMGGLQSAHTRFPCRYRDLTTLKSWPRSTSAIDQSGWPPTEGPNLSPRALVGAVAVAAEVFGAYGRQFRLGRTGGS